MSETAFFSDLSNFKEINRLTVAESSLRKIQEQIFLFLKIKISEPVCLNIVIFYVTSLNKKEVKTKYFSCTISHFVEGIFVIFIRSC